MNENKSDCSVVCILYSILQKLCTVQSVNCRDIEGRQSTPLHFAAGYNRVSVVEYLLQHGADVHAKDKGQVPTIAMASFPLPDLFRKIWKKHFFGNFMIVGRSFVFRKVCYLTLV